MSRVRTYTLPSTSDERQQLVSEITVMCARVLGYPTRQPNVARWTQMEMSELRRVHGNWKMLMARTGQSTAFPDEVPQLPFTSYRVEKD